MSYSYLQEQGEVSSAQSFSDIEPFVLSRLKNTQERSYSKDSGTESSLGFRSGETSTRLTDVHGKRSWILLPEDFLAKEFPQLEKELDLKMHAQGFGAKWSGWFAKYDHDSCSWKTPQCSLLEGLDEFSETWPSWGMMHDGACWELMTQVLPIKEKESGYSPIWPTPVMCMYKGAHLNSMIRKNGRNRANDRLDYKILSVGGSEILPIGKKTLWPNPEWTEWLMGWPIGWTDLKPLVMGRFQRWLRLHGQS